MATINVNWRRLHAQGLDPHDLVKQLQRWEQAGYKVYFQVQNREDLIVFFKMLTAQQDKHRLDTRQFAGLLLMGIIAALLICGVGWYGLIR